MKHSILAPMGNLPEFLLWTLMRTFNVFPFLNQNAMKIDKMVALLYVTFP